MRKRIWLLLVLLTVVGGFIFTEQYLRPGLTVYRTVNYFYENKKPWLEEWLKEEIVLVVFDQKTKEALGGYNSLISRKNLIKAIPIISSMNPRVIALDVFFETETTVDNELQNVLDSGRGKIIWGYVNKQSTFMRRDSAISTRLLPLGHLQLNEATVLGKNIHVVKSCIISEDGKADPPLALLAYEIITGTYTFSTKHCGTWEKGMGINFVFKKGSFGLPYDIHFSLHFSKLPKITDEEGRWIPIHFLGPERFFKRISLIDILDLKNLEDLRGKIVFYGVTISEVKDKHETEFGEMDGVEIHANILATIMHALVEK